MYLIDLFGILHYVGLLGKFGKCLKELLLIVHAVLGGLAMSGIALIAGQELVVLRLRLVVHVFLPFLFSIGVRDALVDGYILTGPDTFDGS